jgi:hypothetical protein
MAILSPQSLILLDVIPKQNRDNELMERIKEAIELCLEFEQEQSEILEFVGVQKVLVQV